LIVLRLLALIYKDILLLIRDRAGFALIFAMPLALVFIMTNLQDATFRAVNENNIPLAILDHDGDSLGVSIRRELQKSGIFTVHTVQPDVSMLQLRDSIALGEYQIGIFIPAQTTAKIRNSVKQKLLSAFEGPPASKPRAIDTSFIQLFLDPTTKASFKVVLVSTVQQYTSGIEYQVTLSEIKKELATRMHFDAAEITPDRIVSYHQQYATMGTGASIPNSVQHNVPAWTLFSMFFIVMSLAGNMIKERNDGSFNRLMVMPCNYGMYVASKLITYFGVCSLQCILIVGMGISILPLVGLPALNVGSGWASLALVAGASALAAIGFGIAVGSIAATHQQSATFGSISVVILAAIGGIWVPVFAMPPYMQRLSVISPLNWGLAGCYDILVRNVGISHVLPEVMKLILFAGACFGIAVATYKFKLRS
jgi:ABC-2 type transport system permease protein